ncbi:DUF2339 domain-containing protein [Paenibacillus polymyxa]|uniref:DUF2339 domain-containing protein n=1 Tax=Paenibacillus polymyxa TaxID=1406 RepID=UPI0025B65004|nr:DUF2339 domain-containing protein [Paenibacillus polymyxa]MDN4078891.1 DUF2339 domain-containing protein [Paenibacillus polymyxa]MDN4104310.1 DUF2339 domain-containing protein [Paenibacillus polymyxa]MDN4114707.1 DUF2339 domain-containing protein [Paenibacillus polymyxa]
MEDFKDRLHTIRQEQNKLLKEYQTLIADYEASDIILENEVLRKKFEDYQARCIHLEERVRHIEQENGKLRTALTEQMLSEKANMIRISREKLETYFASRTAEGENRLTSIEYGAKNRVDQLIQQTTHELKEDQDEIVARLRLFSEEIHDRIMEQRRRFQEAERKLLHQTENELHQLEEEEISEETMQKRMKQNQFEMMLGLNWINKLGILLIILGVGAAFKYSYSNWFTGNMKGVAFFLLGALMLGGGEWLYRKQKQTFALGILGGGISVLYGSIFYSYFLLEIIGMYTGIGLSVLVTVTAVLLSLRYESRTICSFGLVGGYLPLFSYMAANGLEGNAVYIAMGYLFLLNLLILLVSFRKRWVIVQYISFLLNTPLMVVLAWLSESNIASMLYAIITFAMYLGMTLWVPFRLKTKLSWLDFSLLALNTVVSCSVLYSLFGDAGLDDYKGLLALVFCLVYGGLGQWVRRYIPEEKQTKILFYATSLTFAILMIPFQFGVRWLSMGWLIEAVLLTLYGHRYRLKELERAGWGILGLCLGAFFFIDFPIYLLSGFETDYFGLKYTLITLGMLIVTVFYAIEYSRPNAFKNNRLYEMHIMQGFKYVALVNVYLYLLYEAGHWYNIVVSDEFAHYTLYKVLLFTCVSLVLAYFLPKVKLLYDRVIKYYSLALYVIGYALALVVTVAIPTLHEDYAQNTAADYVALIVLVAFNVLVFFSSRDFLNALMTRHYRSNELYPVIMGVYLLGIITAFLGVQFHLGDAGLVFSLVYLLLAILYIVYGFLKRVVYIRRFGLGLTLLSTGKLLLYDLHLLTSGSTIVAYFSFGVVLLAISYIYQKVSNRMGETIIKKDTEEKM